ncbi:hypothetical protein [Azohydromonas caseinilytica]|uniref:Uncharacterized protein n=1 Tax=Azohydromonas caseinilytica TaxID=2728836 RepID=A0A848FH42_9BURK|nr:hypothetical protein [Azohydromonas caseinilytica]NML18788.1 hypothetical protein [Azohydromonas caseinilytica]
MKQNQPPAAEQPAPKTPRAPESSLAAAFDRVAQKSGFDNWKQLDKEQPLPTRSFSPKPALDPDAKPEPPKISNKHLATGGQRAGQQGTDDVSFADFMKGTQPLPSTGKRR